MARVSIAHGHLSLERLDNRFSDIFLISIDRKLVHRNHVDYLLDLHAQVARFKLLLKYLRDLLIDLYHLYRSIN